MNDTLIDREAIYRPLDLSDRCDRCGETSQAFVRAILEIDSKQHELLFCGHHFRKFEPVLVAGGWLIQDDRNMINKTPMSGTPEGVLTPSED